jgi:DNA-binding GntR family transcriptional regulator
MLVSSDLSPGSRLTIDMVARSLHVSPTPVREAFVQLERTGLVTREIHKGYRVAPPISDRQLEALFDTRLILEGGATELAAKDAAALLPLLEDALAVHRAAAERIQRASEHGDIPVDLIRDYFTADWQFHRLIFQSTDNSFLLDMSESISTRIHRMRQTVASGVSDAKYAVEEHARIAAALADGAKPAGDAMRDHIERTRIRSRTDATGRGR